jgi:hypothetical protein
MDTSVKKTLIDLKTVCVSIAPMIGSIPLILLKIKLIVAPNLIIRGASAMMARIDAQGSCVAHSTRTVLIGWLAAETTHACKHASRHPYAEAWFAILARSQRHRNDIKEVRPCLKSI